MTDISAISGLTEAEAAARMLREGHNEIPSGRRRSIFSMAFEIVREPMFLLLVACGLIYLVLGDIREAVMLLGFVIAVMIITFYQEQRSERALEALRDLSSPRALVIREGRQRRIAGWPLILLPVHIVFLELIIDPACSIVFEAECEEEGIMRRRPRDPKDPLFSLKTIGLSLLQGSIVLAGVLAVFMVAMKSGQGESYARTLTITTLVIANIGLIFANRSWSRTIIAAVGSPNPALWWVTAGAAFALAAILFVPFLRGLFHFSALYPKDLFICLAAGLLSVVWFEVLKMFGGRRRQKLFSG